jgi:hypothetical protein
VDAGGLEDSWRQQPGTPAYVADLDAPRLKEALAAAERDRLPEYRSKADDAARPFFASPGSSSKPVFRVADADKRTGKRQSARRYAAPRRAVLLLLFLLTRVLLFYCPSEARYCSSLTCSIQSTALPSRDS